MDFLYL